MLTGIGLRVIFFLYPPYLYYNWSRFVAFAIDPIPYKKANSVFPSNVQIFFADTSRRGLVKKV